MDKLEIMIVDDHEIIRQGLKRLLETEPGFLVVGEAADGLHCLEMLASVRPDVILMDIRMPGISGIETTRLILDRHPEARIIILTIHNEDRLVAKAIQAGARGFVLKNIGRDELVRAVRDVAADRAWLDPQVTSAVLSQLRSEGEPRAATFDPRLTRREMEILHALSGGMSDRVIADTCCISENTVRTHLKSIYRKLKVDSRVQAVTRAMQLGLTDLPPA